MSTAPPNLFSTVAAYMDAILPADNAMKVLLVDEATLHIISMVRSQTFLLSRGVFLVARVDNHSQRKCMGNMRCVVFIRPQVLSVNAVCDELRNPKYESYAIYFSAAAPSELLDSLACADVRGVVRSVCEVFCDFVTLNADAFVTAAPVPNVLLPGFMNSGSLKRVAEGIASTFVAHRRRPYVRYDQRSAFARSLATVLNDVLGENIELYDYKSKDTVLLILDRNSDALTPLITPWTYQSMLNEHVGLQYNRLHFSAATSQNNQEQKGSEEGEGEYVFSPNDDSFFAANMFANWGDLCQNVKEFVDKCKSTINIDRNTATMDEIKDYVQRISHTKSMAGSVEKHATVVTHLSSEIKKRGLLETSLLEQHMIVANDPTGHWNRLQDFVCQRNRGSGDGVATVTDIVRLCLIYHLKYEKPHQPSRVIEVLRGLGANYGDLLRKLRQYNGDRPTEELFGATGVIATIVKSFVDSENIYTQHEAVLKRTLLQLFSGRLPVEQYPYLGPSSPGNAGASCFHQPQQPFTFKPKEVIVFMCGGYTYSEAAVINAINTGSAYTGSAASSLPQGPVHACIGGTGVLNSETFLSLLAAHA
ncbi:vacuolar protein sorting-associated protein 45, putative [Trypanosoma equiperdum]|uniref:Vacuolar protein sorting-associated protein 45, putative n=1 Tax=Trypanosoma equiperdum TaxID=5694 RepID=A0A1G4IFG3_TRYEQ|nr:vacuolar protein sorting-associated protein 45, putative [Trypanosoma equiperdum]